MTVRHVLFVCTGNTCRSPLAEHLFRRRAAADGLGGVEVRSAGVAAFPGAPASPETVAALSRRGADASGHRASVFDGDLAAWADLILTMEERHREIIAARWPAAAGKAHTLKTYAGLGGGDVADPIGRTPEVYEACAVEIDGALERILKNWPPPGGA